MLFALPVKKVQILTNRSGTDRILFTLEKEAGCWPFEEDAYVSMDVAKGKAQAWMAEHYPSIVPQVVELAGA